MVLSRKYKINAMLSHGLDSVICRTVTSFMANGLLVLRHELGHSIILVGDEYDEGHGDGYFGVNAIQNLSTPISWAHWLTQPDSKPHAERAVMPMQAYP